MPNWQPNWDDVVFDHGVAAAAAAACRAAAGTVDGVLGAESGQRATALAGWSGLSANRFDDAAVDVAGRLGTTETDLRTLADAIDDASEAATLEQDRREAQRERWHEQVAAESREAREQAQRERIPR